MKEGDKIVPSMAGRYFNLFVNRAAYTVQSKKPAINGKYYYYRPKGQRRLDFQTILRHLRGDITVGLYAINPTTQRSKWVAIDADYAAAFEHLLRIQIELKSDAIQSALERSRRGAHLWIFGAQPLLASECRLYVYNLATRLKLPIKTAGNTDGIEVFPRQDHVAPDEFGNAIRGPLGVHRGAGGKRFWFYDAQPNFEAQLCLLERLKKLTDEQLHNLVSGLEMPEAFKPRPVVFLRPFDPTRREFHILDHVPKGRRSGKDYRTKCPSCSLLGRDKNNDNLAVSVSDPRKYKCWAGCSKEEIRAALGCPIRQLATNGAWQRTNPNA
jgi:hypothetical protein